jgi:ATP-dependent helicase/nuclease subunit B
VARVFTIPPEVPFLDALAAGLLAESGGDPAQLARATILLPTRRAVRAMAEAFLRASEGHALLLPRLVPVGDLDADELALVGDEGDGGGIDIAPAVPDLRRRLMLTRLVLRWGRVAGVGPLAPGQAAPLAASLASFLDEVQASDGTLDDLEHLVPDEHAEHWQKVILFLDILRRHWPGALAEIACLDPADRRNRVLAAQIEEWRRAPPAHPVIAAGITGGVPAVVELVAAVAALPDGRVVLPGLARDAEPEDWSGFAIDPTHPQHLLALLLDRLGLDPAEVRDWPHDGVAGSPAERRKLVFEALRPAETSGRWREERVAPRAIEGLHRIDCPGAQEEALVIALLLREALQKSGETAALVTPDRDLARRVAAELRRWRIEIDDSAGVALHHTPPGVFLRLVLAAVAEAMAPVPLLALLKHPLAACGRAPESCRALARELEQVALRGPRPEPGFVGLRARLGEKEAPRALFGFLGAVEAALAPLVEALAAKEAGLAGLVAAHLAASEALARTDRDSGAHRLWREPAGEAAAQLMSELLDAASSFEPLDGADYPALFAALSSGPVVRPPYGHPRLFIWGLLEARLQHADRVVLGGLNEGTWPRGAEPDPWLSRPMRQNFGLPPPERRVGIAAHDFAQAMGAREVFLTRATRVEGTPTVPSRWLLRLDAVLAEGGLDERLKSSYAALAWAEHIDAAERIAIAPPAPCPPVALRPRRLSVTEIETLMRDPYAVYARHVLGLKALDKLAVDPGPAERGIYIHKTLDRFLKAHPAALPADALDRLISFGREAFGAALERPFVRAFWWPRFRRIAEWFVAEESSRRARLLTIAAECKGGLVLDAPYAPFELHGRADRIDRLASGGLAIIDFKTGGVPNRDDISLGFSPQLPLEAAIAEAGGFAGVPAAKVEELAFWQLSGRDPAGKIKDVADTPAELRQRIADALRGLQRLVARFDDETTPYRSEPRPDKAPRYSDYVHLARVKEWSVADGEGEA